MSVHKEVNSAGLEGHINIIDEIDIDKLLTCKTLEEAASMFNNIIIVA